VAVVMLLAPLFALLAAARADDAPAAAGGAGDSADAAWLQSIQDAARRQSFSGTIVYQRGNELHFSRVVQSVAGGESRERVQTLDGQAREFIRVGDTVQCLYPQLRRVVVERNGARTFPAFAAPLPADLLEHYELRRGASERVAGMMCDTVNLVPRDQLRYGYRLWVEPRSGLLFKAQTVGLDGSVLEQVAFTDVRVGEPIDPAQLKPSWAIDGWQVDNPAPQHTQLAQQGWSVTPPSGFRRLVEVVRKFLRGPEQAGQSPAVQAVYTDGLATVSVFIEPGAPMIDDPEDGAPASGPLSVVSRRVGEARVTVIGDIPREAAKSVAESVVYSPPASH
jgi:sigma-E factor negative regulatory protein RseB